jgi:hypothetical protein
LLLIVVAAASRARGRAAVLEVRIEDKTSPSLSHTKHKDKKLTLWARCVDILISTNNVNLEALMIMSWSCHKDECKRPIRCEIAYGKGKPDAAMPLPGA